MRNIKFVGSGSVPKGLTHEDVEHHIRMIAPATANVGELRLALQLIHDEALPIPWWEFKHGMRQVPPTKEDCEA